MTSLDQAALSAAVEARLPLAASLFDEIRGVSEDDPGVTRPAYSEVDSAAAELVAKAARELDLEVAYDRAGNLLCVLPGHNRSAKAVLTGSHLDSVPKGGHFDGLAGFIAGIVAQAALADIGAKPECDIVSIGLRGEESVWFGIPFVGSRLALGTLPHTQLDSLRRGDTGRSAAEHMAVAGIDVEALRAETEPAISPANTRAYFELHIEQGPVLVGAGVPVAIPTVIRGNIRWPHARCDGQYDHSSATPRSYRQDTVLAVSELVLALELFWKEQEKAGVPDTVFTVGKFFTDAVHHAMTKVPGRVDFTLNFGGTSQEFLDLCREKVEQLAAEIGARRRVAFSLGECVRAAPAPLDSNLRTLLQQTADELAIPSRSFATVGHDAAVFLRAGIPAAMVLVRNDRGSHNPEEAMALEDFGEGVKVLAAAMSKLVS